MRALDAGARIEYDPVLVVTHEDTRVSPDALSSLGSRDGASIGYILRKHRYPTRTVGAHARPPARRRASWRSRGRDRARARFHLSTLRGRVLGYRS